jgi:hypothetical protein
MEPLAGIPLCATGLSSDGRRLPRIIPPSPFGPCSSLSPPCTVSLIGRRRLRGMRRSDVFFGRRPVRKEKK